MPIRQSLGQEVKETGFVHRMLAEAIKAQKAHLKEIEEFGTSESELRREHNYLSWLEQHKRHEGDVKLVKSSG